MQRTLLPVLLCAVSVSLVQAATEEEVCRVLSASLQQETEVLASVQDAATAAAAVAPLKEVLAKLASLKGQVNDNTLWNYIDSTQGVKPELMTRVRNLAKEFTRLEKASFFGDKELSQTLAPQLKPNGKNPDVQ